MDSLSWFAIRTKPRHEKTVAAGLAGKGYEQFLPSYTARRHWSDQAKVELPLFPGYLFGRFDVQKRLPILTTPGVLGIVGVGRVAVPVDDAEIAALQTAVRSGIPAQPCRFVQVGERVRIVEGALAGVEGVLLSARGCDRIVLSVSLLQRSVSLEIDRNCVEPIVPVYATFGVAQTISEGRGGHDPVSSRLGRFPTLLAGLLFTAVSVLAQPPREGGKVFTKYEKGYVLGVGDQVTMIGSEPEEIINKPVRIDANGFVTLPLLGSVRAGGRTVEQFEKDVTAALRTWVMNPHVSVNVSDYRSQQISVIGAVNTPGVQILNSAKTMAQALAQAGGVRQDAGYSLSVTRAIEHGRIPIAGAHDDPSGRFSTAQIDLKKLVEPGAPEQNLTVKPGDVLSVPRGEMIYVIGNVRRAGGFVLQERETLSALQALSMAEGLAPGAAPRNARILRRPNGRLDRTEVRVNLQHILGGKAPDVPLRADDILFIPGSTARTIMGRSAEAAVSIGTGLLIYRR